MDDQTHESNKDIIKSWVNLYSDILYSKALYGTSNKETAEDLVQETFLAAIKSFDKFQNRSETKTWLISILKNKIADYFRKSYKNKSINAISLDYFFDSTDSWQKEQRPQEWDVNSEINLLDDLAFKRILSDCLDRLPESWRSSITMKFLEEKAGDQICQELNITSTNYWQMMHRAKLQLRKCLELNWFTK